MELKYDEINIGGQLLIASGILELSEHTIGLIRGANGSGKSLLLRNLLVNVPNSGIRVGLLNQSKEALVLSEGVLQNIAMTTDEENCAKIRTVVESLGFAELLSKNISRLSGGEARMVCILRCLLSESELVLLDEPTNDLDYDKVIRLKELLLKYKDRKTIVIVSHDDRMAQLAETVYEVREKKLHRLTKAPKVNVPESDVQAGKSIIVAEDNYEGVSGDCSFCEERPDRKVSSEQRKAIAELTGITHRNRFLRKMFTFNFCSFFVAMFFCVILYFPAKSLFSTNDTTNEEKPANQILLFQFDSRWFSGEYEDPTASNGMMPVEFVNLLRTGSLQDSAKAVQALREYADTQYYIIYHSVDIPSTDIYDVYPLEYYDRDKGYSTTVLQEYVMLQNRGGKDYLNAFRTANGYFRVPKDYMDEKGIEFDPVKWRKVADSLASDTSTCCAAYVVMKEGHSIDEFYESEAFKTLYEKQVYVTSLEIFRLLCEAKRITCLKDYAFQILLGMISLLILCASGTILFLLTQRTKIRACRDYGISVRELYLNCERKLCNRIPLIVPVIVFGIWNFLQTRKLPFLQTNWIYTGIFLIEVSLMYYVQRKTSEFYIKYCYRWNVR